MYNNKAVKLYQQASILQQKGKLAEAERAYKKAIKINQNFVEAHNNLGNVLLDRGRLKEASVAFRKALRLQPGHPMLLRNLGDTLQLQGDHDPAIDCYNKAIEQDPEYAGVHVNLGNSLRDTKRFRDAVSSYRRALEIDPSLGDAYYNLGGVLFEVDELDDAVVNFNQAIDIDRGHIDAYNGLGNALVAIGETDKAIAAYCKAIEINPTHIDAHIGLGNVLSDLGEIDEAITSYRKALEIEPANADVYRNLSNLKKFSENDDDIRAMQSLYASKHIADEQKMYLGFALGKAYEDIGEYQKSMEFILDAARLKREAIDYSIVESQDLFSRIKAIFSPDYFAARKDHGNPDQTPIFILGMPRSGTSLVEQILASHPKVFGAGELKDLSSLSAKICAANASAQFPEGIVELDAAAFDELAKTYIARIRSHSADARFVTDKMPNNFPYIGVIKTILPNARILHCTRDPMDNCLSIFKNYFSDAHHYSYDLAELGQYYNGYLDLMAYWKQTLPDSIYDLSYEQLVADPGNQIRALLEYCNLPWDDACLNFHQTRRKVRTLSNAQVRLPIYRDSVALWKRYEQHLQPLCNVIYG